MKTSRIELHFEQHEIWRISRSDNAETTMCPYCDEDSAMIGVEHLVAVSGESPRSIYKLIDERQLHFLETPRMQVLVCLASFSKRSNDNNEKEALVES